MIKTVKEDATVEITVKKSKFISNIFYVETEKQANEYLKKINQKYNDARHNCYAYILKEINGNDIMQIQKSSDNGEPSGTAGAPLLAVLKNNELCNVLVVVTRYFGGILLGTGGLVKAYTESAIKAIEKTQIIKKEIGNLYEIQIDYSELKKIKYNAEKIGYTVENIEYEENVKIAIKATTNKFEELLKTDTKIISQKLKESNLWIN